jgi:energy-coupling factor transporter ATP-binding protein EcfA2
MKKTLTQLTEYFSQRYGALYGDPNWQFPEKETFEGNRPLLLWQTADLHRTANLDEAAGVAILDPSIGTCLYVLGYDSKMPVRRQVARALQIRSALLPISEATKHGTPDPFGGWRLAVHWLVDEKELPKWISEVAELREQTAHFEEVPVDAVICRNDDWAGAFIEHAFPRLLFQVRSVLRKTNADEVERWQSADALVIKTLAQISAVFKSPLSKQCGSEVELFLSGRAATQSKGNPSSKDCPPRDLYELTVENFRNIDRLAINFRSMSEGAEATVIQGPNGSGKSSVYEALSIAVTGASSRYETYLNDKSRAVLTRQDNYVSDYLRNLTSNDQPVRMAVNSTELKDLLLVPEDQVHNRVQSLNGSFLSQEASKSFVRMSASELGGEIAASLSVIASEVAQFVDERTASALDRVKDFNLKWGLRANVVKRETVVTQIAQRKLQASLPNVSEIISWLGSESLWNLSIAQQYRDVCERWKNWQGNTERVAVIIGRAPAGIAATNAAVEHLTAFNLLIAGTAEIYKRAEELATNLSPSIDAELRQWGDWLRRRSAIEAVEDEKAVLLVREDLISTNSAIASLTEVGRLSSERAKHLEAASAFISQWGMMHAATCPTCDSDVSGRGGIAEVVRALAKQVQDELSASRQSFESLKSSQKELSAKLASMGVETPPVSADQSSRYLSIFGWLLPESISLEDIVKNPDQLGSLLARFKHMRVRPELPRTRGDLDEFAKDLCRDLVETSDEHERLSKLPDAWKEVQREVRQRLAIITATHLPRTLQALWLELAKNIMPASWQQPGRVEFRTGTRQIPEASVVITSEFRTVLASYILNGAEVHNLGLAWFFAKYLTSGRFKNRFIVLDDPTDSMDQPTFRDLCRFLETLLRLHRVESIPLSLVVLLHEDQRALDTARATDAVMYQLRWNRHTRSLGQPLRVYGEQMAPPIPFAILETG